jgi:hypothetical protein
MIGRISPQDSNAWHAWHFSGIRVRPEAGMGIYLKSACGVTRMELSRLTRSGRALAWLAVAVMTATAWLTGRNLHAMHYGGGCVLLATCAAGLIVFAGGGLLLRVLGVRLMKCRKRGGPAM